MATITRFEDLLVWIKARRLAARVDELCCGPDLRRNFVLVDQMRRASLSIALNIAEGFERRSPREFGYFLRVAKGSAAELRAQLYLCEDRNYLDAETCATARQDTSEIARMLNALIGYLETRLVRQRK